MVDDAIDERGGARGVWEDGGPVAEGEVGGQHQALALVAATDDLEQEVCVARVVGQISDLIDTEQRARRVVAKTAVERARRFLRAEVEQELRRGDEERAVPAVSAAWTMFWAIIVLPRPSGATRTTLRASARKSRRTAASTASPSMREGQAQSKSAMGLKPPSLLRPTRRSRLRLARSRYEATA